VPPDSRALETSLRALELWKALDIAYAQVESCLTGEDLAAAGALAEHLADVGRRLEPLVDNVAELREASRRPDPVLNAIWREIDQLVASLAERQPSLVRAARAARDATGSLLVKVQGTRSHAARYRSRPAPAPRFASRRV